MRHSLLNINIEDKTADCIVCGKVRIVRSGIQHGKDRWRCKSKSQLLNQQKSFNRLKIKDKDFIRVNNCEICGKTVEENGKRLAIDHNHFTSKLRGFLCTSCNLGIGCFKDDVNKLKNAIKYLKTKGVN